MSEPLFIQAIESSIEGIKVKWIAGHPFAVIISGNQRLALKRLASFDIYEKTGTDTIKIYSSEKAWAKDTIECYLRNVLEPFLPQNLHTDINVNVAQEAMEIHIPIFGKDRDGQMIRAINEALVECRRIYPASTINTFTGNSRIYPSIAASSLETEQDSLCTSDIDYPDNPNWPSRTGNPSGKGRGNNPPRGK